ncbi:MAG TPA: WD40 repeat domain-containing protein [Solirubrobacteraceae bacterium]
MLSGHGDWVLDAAFTPDGKSVATVDAQGGLLLRDPGANPGSTPRPQRLGFRLLNSVAYDRAGQRIILAGERIVPTGDTSEERGRILVADAGTLQQTDELQLIDVVTTASLSKGGRWLLATTDVGSSRLWHMRDGKQRGRSLELPAAWSAAFSPDGRSIVTTAGDGIVRVLETATQELRHTHRHPGAAGAAFSPDGKTVVSFGSDATAQLWDIATGHKRRILRGHTGFIASAAFSPDGKRIVTAGADQTTRVWEVKTGKLLFAQRMHDDYVNRVAFAPDGKNILSASDDRTARIYPCTTCVSIDRLLDVAKRRSFFKDDELKAVVAGR